MASGASLGYDPTPYYTQRKGGRDLAAWEAAPPGTRRTQHPPSSPRRKPGDSGPIISPQLAEQMSVTAHALSSAHVALAEEKRKVLSARMDNTRWRVEAERAKAEAGKAWKSAWESAEHEHSKREAQVAAQMEADRRKLEVKLRQTLEERDSEMEQLIKEEVDRREAQLPLLRDELSRLKAEWEARLGAAAEERRKALERQKVELLGTVEELSAFKALEQKEARVEALRRKALRRIQNAGLAAGWTAWHELWEQKARKKRMLAAAGARLARPALAAAVAHWRADWTAAQKKKALGEKRSELEETRARAAALEAQLAQEARKLAAAEARCHEKEQQVLLLTGGQEEAARHAAARAEREREKRVENLAHRAMKRLQNAGILRGWTAWHELYEEAARQRRMLAAAAARLARPQQTAALAAWKADWMSERAAALKAAAQGKGATKLERELARLREEHAKQIAALEASKTTALERLRTELAGSAEEQAALREAQEREVRVAALATKAMKRIQNAGLTAGWTAWHSMWEEAARQKRMLAAAGARLAKPALTAALAHWRADWQAVRDEAFKSSATRLEESERRRQLLEAEVLRLREEKEREKREAAESKTTALERLRMELAGSAEEQAAAREAAEREARVAALATKAMKRIQNAGLTAGWTAWHDQWEEAARQKRMLAAAGARLAKPALTAALAHWRADWEHEVNAEKLAAQRSAQGEQGRRLESLEAELKRLHDDHARAMATAAEKHTTALERQRMELAGSTEEQAAAREAAEREARVEALATKAMKRIQNAGITAGWTAWHEVWEEATRQKQMLAAAGARLTRPALTAALSHWRADWQAAQLEAAMAAEKKKMMETNEVLRESERRRRALEEEINRLQADHERALVRAEEKQATALERLRVELGGSAEEQAAAREAAEREARVAALATKAMKRIQNAGLTAGWTAWHDQWEEAARQKRMLAAAGARLARPALAAAVAHWRSDWEGTQLAAAMQSQKGKQHEQRRVVESLEAELTQLRSDLQRQQQQAADAQAKALERQRIELAGTAEQQAALREQEAREKRVEAIAQKAMRRIKNGGILRGWTAWHSMWEEAARQKRMLAAAGARLAKPALTAALAHWRADWTAAQRVEARKAMGGGVRAQIESEMAAVRAAAEAELAAIAQKLDRAEARRREAEDKLLEYTGSTEELERRAEQRLEEQKAARIDHLHRSAARRIQNQGLLRGWMAWHEQWFARARQSRILAGAAARLARPQLTACISHWRLDWQGARRQQAMSTQLRAARMRSEEPLEAELLRLKEQAERREQSLAERHALELERLRIELTGSSDEVLAMREQQAKEGRVDLLHKKAARRIRNQDIVRGFTAWQESWYLKTRQQRLLASATARLAKPALVAYFSFLRSEAARRKKNKQKSEWDKKLATIQKAGEHLLKQERRTAAENRLKLQETIRSLEKQIKELGAQAAVPIPPPEPTTLVLHTISAFGLPDADAGGGSDPYARFIMLDHDFSKKETAYTSYKYKELNPIWEGERLQIKLAPGGTKPPKLRIEVWDKDQKTPDDMMAASEIVLDNCVDGGMGTLTLPLVAADPDDNDVEGFTFSYEFQADPEEVQATKKSVMPAFGSATQKAAIQKAKTQAPAASAPAPAEDGGAAPQKSTAKGKKR